MLRRRPAHIRCGVLRHTPHCLAHLRLPPAADSWPTLPASPAGGRGLIMNSSIKQVHCIRAAGTPISNPSARPAEGLGAGAEGLGGWVGAYAMNARPNGAGRMGQRARSVLNVCSSRSAPSASVCLSAGRVGLLPSVPTPPAAELAYSGAPPAAFQFAISSRRRTRLGLNRPGDTDGTCAGTNHPPTLD